MAFIGNSPSTQTFTGGMDQFNGNASNTSFSLSRTINTVYDVDVYVESVFQRPGVAYTVSANTISFTSAPAAGSNNVVVVYKSFNATSVLPVDGSVSTRHLGTVTNINAGTNAGLTLQANNSTYVTLAANGITTVGNLVANGSTTVSSLVAGNTTISDLAVSGNTTISAKLTVGGSVTATGNVTAASVEYVAGHPLSIKGCITWIDLDLSYTYPTTNDTMQQYGIRDLGTNGLSWVMRSQNSAGYRACTTTSAPGTSKRVLKTGTTSDSGVIGCSVDRKSRIFYDQPNTMVFWAWHGTGAIQSNESLITQYNTVNGVNYQIIRGYPSSWNIYCNGTSDANVSYVNTGGYNTGAWTMFAFVMGYGSFRIYKYNQSNQSGVYDTGAFTQSWYWDGTSGSRAMFIGGSEWGSNSGEPWGVGSGTTGNGYIGPFMWYNSALSQTELTPLFNYYKTSFGIT